MSKLNDLFLNAALSNVEFPSRDLPVYTFAVENSTEISFTSKIDTPLLCFLAENVLVDSSDAFSRCVRDVYQASDSRSLIGQQYIDYREIDLRDDMISYYVQTSNYNALQVSVCIWSGDANQDKIDHALKYRRTFNLMYDVVNDAHLSEPEDGDENDDINPALRAELDRIITADHARRELITSLEHHCTSTHLAGFGSMFLACDDIREHLNLKYAE